MQDNYRHQNHWQMAQAYPRSGRFLRDFHLFLTVISKNTDQYCMDFVWPDQKCSTRLDTNTDTK